MNKNSLRNPEENVVSKFTTLCIYDHIMGYIKCLGKNVIS